jgi:FKBP-type peptidyl-prolyl cis-trans isomerase
VLRSSAVALTAASLLLLTACGSSDTPASSAGAGSATSRAAATTAAAAAPTGCAPATAAAPPGVPALTGNPTDTTTQAVISAGTGTAPAALVTQDVVTCTGTAATAAATVAVRYTGALYTDGTVFDASWKSGNAPVSFPLSKVVPGFAQGIVGMHLGDRRVIVIPPALGYGARTSGPIPGGSTLVFVVDLVGIS